MTHKMAALLGIVSVVTLASFSPAQAADVDLSATHAKQAANRAQIAAQIETAQALGISPVLAAQLDHIKAKQAANRREIAALIEKSRALHINPELMAKLERIKAKQGKSRPEIVEHIKNRRPPLNVTDHEHEG